MGSGLAESHELYTRAAHRKRALEMYSTSAAAPLVATRTGAENRTKPTSTTTRTQTPEQPPPPPTATQKTDTTTPENTPRQGGLFPILLETFPISKPSKPEVKEKASKEQKEDAPLNRISISGNYIPPPPQALGFARRTGKFHPLSASVDMGTPSAKQDTTNKTSSNIPELRILEEGEEIGSF